MFCSTMQLVDLGPEEGEKYLKEVGTQRYDDRSRIHFDFAIDYLAVVVLLTRNTIYMPEKEHLKTSLPTHLICYRLGVERWML